MKTRLESKKKKHDGNMCSQIRKFTVSWSLGYETRNSKVKLSWERAEDHVFFKFSHALITCCWIARAGSNCAIVSRSGYIWIWSWVGDQESTNRNAGFTAWKSRYTTIELTLIQWNANKLWGIQRLSLRVDAFLLIVQCTAIFNSSCSFDAIITFACAV